MFQEKEHVIRHRVGSVLGLLVCLSLLPVLAINITLIVKSSLNSGKVPSVGGYMPLIVLSDSMHPYIREGDLIICHTAEAEAVRVGDVISFFSEENGNSVVSHRVTAVVYENGALAFRTKGDANRVEDEAVVPADHLVGIFRYRIAGAGRIVLFMQSTTGLILCVIVPLLFLAGYDFLRQGAYERKLLKELEAQRTGK